MTGTSNVGLSDAQLSQPRRRMLDLVNRLHSTGVQVDVDLPQIAVIGSQSAGKSSLIEAISGITLPRAAGTCTRCPTECRLSHSDSPWQCKVSLRFITDKNGQLLGQACNETFGAVIYDKAEVEDRIKRAQRAILNPSRPRKDFLTAGDEDDAETSELSFSSNCVSLQISGPDVADLSFCDLPGLIASVSSSGRMNDISLVENLVTSYIKKPSCIILLTVTCETDFENQGAHRLARQLDPEGKRTVGVLTKPDRIPDGEHAHWLPFIRNEKEPLDNNWFCVKQPSSIDMKQKITWEDARKREDEYFSLTAPWNELDSTYLKYLRTRNLVDRLSSVLSDLIAKRLPQIQEELENSIMKARETLRALPHPPSSDPVNEVASLLYDFCADLHHHIEGVPGDTGLLQVIRPVQDRFRRAIRETAPDFVPFERKRARGKTLDPPTFLIGDDEDAMSESDANTKGKKRKDDGAKIYVDEVLTRAHRARTRELPGNYPFAVQKTFIVDLVKEWERPALAYLQSVHNIMLAHTKDLVSDHFGHFGQGILEQKVGMIVHNHLKQCFSKAEERVIWLLETEQSPFTVNYHYLSDYKSKFLSYFKSARDKEIRGGVAAQIEALVGGGEPSHRPIASSIMHAPIIPPPNPPPPPTSPFSIAATPAPAPTRAFAPLPAGRVSLSSSKTSGPGTKAAGVVIHQKPSAEDSGDESGSGTGESGEESASEFTKFGASGTGFGNLAPAAPSLPLFAPTAIPFATSSFSFPPPSQPMLATPATAALDAGITKVLTGLTEMGIVGVKPEDLYRILPPDEMEPAIEIMASVRAYFQVAYKRFADNVPQAVDHELVRGVEKDILKILCTKLGTNGPQSQKNCAEYAQESPQIADRRQDVMKKLERLQGAMVELMDIGL